MNKYLPLVCDIIAALASVMFLCAIHKANYLQIKGLIMVVSALVIFGRAAYLILTKDIKKVF